MIEIGSKPLAIADVVSIARQATPVQLTAMACRRVADAHGVLERLAASGQPIYGVTTGLGAAVDIKVSADAASVQRRVPLARSVGVGRLAATEEVRAIMAARLAGLAIGRSGASLGIVEALAAMLNRGVHPRVPMTGSVGEADLAPLAHIAAVLVGAGAAEWRGETLSGADALARAGIAPPPLGVKDGLALVSSNAGAAGLGALVVRDARQALAALTAATALSLEGFRAALAPLDPRAAALRPAPGQARIAACLLDLLQGGDLVRPGAARRLQDPLSLRCAAPIMGSGLAALDGAADAVRLELGSSDDNPAILAEADCTLPNANFDATHLALAFETLGLAATRMAAACGERVMKLMSPGFSDLPRFLTPVQDGRTGFATVQKTVSALVAEIQYRAMPMPAVVIPVADRVEDYGSMALSVVEKTGEVFARLRLLAAVELIVAAQACDLRAGVTLGQGTGAIHRAVRAVVAPLAEDRASAPDIAALDAAIQDGQFDAIIGDRLGVL